MCLAQRRTKPDSATNECAVSSVTGLSLKYSDPKIFQSRLSNPLSQAVRKLKCLSQKAANAVEPSVLSRSNSRNRPLIDAKSYRRLRNQMEH
jgi:hypothetical protein